MAVLVEAISVVVRAAAIHEKYPGGWPAFRDAVPNATLCCDNELARVGFMTPDDTKAFVQALETRGLQYQHEGAAIDMVVVDQRRGPAARCSWIEFGHIPASDSPTSKIAACRLKGSVEQRVFMPDGWSFESSLSARHLYVDEGWIPEFMDFVRHENGLDVYRDLRTGKEVFVGRTSR